MPASLAALPLLLPTALALVGPEPTERDPNTVIEAPEAAAEPTEAAAPAPSEAAAPAVGASADASELPRVKPGEVPVPAESDADDPFKLDLAIDLPVIGAAAAIYLSTELLQGEFTWAGCATCDPSHLGPLDRRVLDNYSKPAALASDILLYSSIGAPIVADLGDVLIHRKGMRSWSKDLAVLVEVGAVNAAMTGIVKYAVARPRPYSYGMSGGDYDPTEGDARLSFYSGHTSTVFAMATAYGYLFTARHPRSPWIAPVWILGYGAAATTGVMRVTAGKHFWSDVVVGAIAGSAVGLVIPALHRRRASSRRFAGLGLNLAASRTSSVLALRGAF